jgi:hypothetical protein
MVVLSVDIVCYFTGAIGGYSINGYWRLFINGYSWLNYYKLLVVILLMAISGYFINHY